MKLKNLIHPQAPTNITKPTIVDELDIAQWNNFLVVLRDLVKPKSLDVIRLLHLHEILTVTDIYIKLRCEQSVASQILTRLRRAGVVKTERQGKFIYYSLDEIKLKSIDSLLNTIKLL